MADIIEIKEFDINDFGKSSNFGGGLELLMNDKARDNGNMTSDIELEDLNNLENELNNLVDNTSADSYKPRSDLFSSPSSMFDDRPSVRFSNMNGDQEPSIGEFTANTDTGNKTWDGFGKFNDIPVNPDKEIPLEPKMTKEELLREKFKYLRKLEALEKKGIELSKKYNMDSSLQEMQGEYETIMEEKQKQNSIKFQGNMLMAVINGIESLTLLTLNWTDGAVSLKKT